jgi:uncharacterized protein (DUF1778 family)
MKIEKEKETRLSVRMSPEELEILKDFAASKGENLSDWVKRILLSEAGLKRDRISELEQRLTALESKIAA